MARDAARMRGDGPTVFAQVTNGVGVEDIVRHLVATWERAVEPAGRAKT
jgi:urease accessory protein